MKTYNDIINLIKDAEIQIHNGECDVLERYAELKQIEKQLKETLTNIKHEVFEDVSKYGEKMFEHRGFFFERKNGGRYYDFKGVPQWVEANKQLKEIETRSKAVANDSNIIASTDDGEQIEPCVVKYKSDSVIVKQVTK